MLYDTRGEPITIDRVWFQARYGQNFPDLLAKDKSDFLDTCIEDVYTLFKGVAELWKALDNDVYVRKTQMCYGLLTAWYISDVFPLYTVGVVSSSGIPLKSKKIGGVNITFGDTQASAGGKLNADILQALKSNPFGAKAYLMIKSSGRLTMLLR